MSEPNLDEWFSYLDELSKINKMGGKGNGDLEDNCYICGISPSKHKEYIKAIIAQQVEQAKGCVDCKKLRCENCERLWQT